MTEIARAAAKWWADQLRQSPIHNNGEGEQSIFLTYAASLLYQPLDTDAIQTFEDRLTEHIARRIERNEHVMLSTDYDPDYELRQVAAAAGVDLGMRLPVKTLMSIYRGVAKVSAGYHAPTVQIYPAESEQP